MLYSDGHAVRANRVPLTDLSPSPDFAVAAEACGAWGVRVDTCEEFETALAEAAAYVRDGRGTAVIDARVARHCPFPDLSRLQSQPLAGLLKSRPVGNGPGADHPVA